MDTFYRANVTDGLFQNQWYMDDGKPDVGKCSSPENRHTIFKFSAFFSFSFLGHVHITIGATTDSGYEYLLKQWIQSGDPKARQQCKQSVQSPLFFLTFLQFVF